MDELGEPIDVYRHEAPYSVRYGERRIVFHRDVDRFIDELAEAFPGTRDSLRAFYDELYALHPLIAGSSASRITSYNVCYTKLLRVATSFPKTS